ncbi:trichohyalin-like [Sardina pilchardus]|uniref:trichohyalin-like n=1 Tax=Sardina pilchardus TaxID=27697 RepID=UPI002E0F9257
MGTTQESDIKQKMDVVKDSVKDIDEAFGIMDDKVNTEKRTVRNRREREEEKKGDIKQVKKEELLDDWLEEREQKTTEERMQELREKRLKRLQEKTQEMEEKREKEREIAEKQLVRQREVEQKAEMIRLLLTDSQGESEKKEMTKEKKVEVRESSPNDKKVSESDWHSEIEVEKVPQRQRLTQNCTTNEVIKTAWDVEMEKKKVLQSGIEWELNSSRLFGIDKDKENQKELNEMVIQREKIKESRQNYKLRVSESDWHTEIEMDNVPRRQRPTQNCATNETASNVKMDKKKELQNDMRRDIKHTKVEWQNSSRLLEIEKEKKDQERWARDWKEEMAKQKELNEMVIQQEHVEVKELSPNDKLRVSESNWHSEKEMGNVPQRQRPTQNCATNVVIKTACEVKMDKKKELQTDIERELKHTVVGWQNSSRLLEIEKEKDSQKRWDRDWEEEMAKQKELNEKEDRQKQLKKQREEQERQEQKELEKQREMARQKEIERQKEQEKEMRKEIEKQVEMEKQRELEREKELQRKRDRKQKEEIEKQRVLEEFNQGQRKEDNRVKMAWKTQTHNNEKPTKITEQQLVHQTLIQSQEVASGDPYVCELLDIEPDGEGSGIIPFSGRLIPKSEIEEARRQQEMASLHQCSEFYCKTDCDESVSEKARRLEIENLKKGNVAFMPLKTEEETQGTTEQELPQDFSEGPDPEMRHEEEETRGTTEQELSQDFSEGPDPEMRHGEEKMDEEQSKGQLENTSPHLDDTNSSNETELVGEGSKAVKDKSVRRRLFHWANEKAKKHFVGKIEKTIVREQEEGDQLHHPWYMPYAVTRADREKEKRRAYLNYEDARQQMETKWHKWQVNKAERKKQKKAEREIFEREFKESLAAYYNHPGMYYGFPGAFVNRSVG